MTDYMSLASRAVYMCQTRGGMSEREAMMHTLAKRLEALDTERAAHEAAKAELQIARAMQHAYALDKKEAEAELQAITIALHDAIRRPMGVVPASADRFYNPVLAAQAEVRRIEKDA